MRIVPITGASMVYKKKRGHASPDIEAVMGQPADQGEATVVGSRDLTSAGQPSKNGLILFAAIFLLVGGYFIVRSFAAPTTVQVNSASSLVAALKDPNNAGGTIEVTANLGEINVDGAAPSSLVTVRPGTGGGTVGTIKLSRNNSNLRFEGFRMTGAMVNVGNSTNTTNNNIQFANCTAGGTEANRIKPFAIFEIYGTANDLLIDNCDIGWTDTSPNGGPDVGYGVRAIGGSGKINRLKITRSKIHHTGCDNIQLGVNDDFQMDRTELAYAASAPGTDCHADSIQIMGSSGSNSRITNSWIHHMGYYSSTVTPSSSGQLILHGWNGATPWLVQNNLFTNNRNFTPEYKEENDGAFARNWTWDRNTILSSFNTEGNGCSTDFGGAQAALTNNIIRNLCGRSVSYATASGNVGIDSTPTGGIRAAVTFDGNFVPQNLPAGFTDAGYRVPSDVHWAPGATRIPGAGSTATPPPTPPSTPPADTTKPNVSLTAPAANATVKGNSVAVSANATDNVAVAKVEFFIDNSTTPVASDTTAPYTFNWDSTKIADGSHTISAKATDTHNNVSNPAQVAVTVSNTVVTPPPPPPPSADTTAPVTNITAPSSGATVQGVVQVSANAVDNVAVSRVEVYIDGMRVSSMATAPYIFGWNTLGISNGSHRIQSRAYDAAGNIGTSSIVTVTLNNPDTQPPNIPARPSVTAVSSSRVNVSWTAATDNVGVSKYYVQRNGVVVATVAGGLSYSDLNVNAGTRYSYAIIAVDAAGNASAPSASASVTTPAAPDTSAPSVPSGLTATAVSPVQVNLSWSASTDTGGSGLKGYKVYRDSTQIADVTTTTYGDATVKEGTNYSYHVVAYDAAGNTSAPSSPALVRTPTPPATTQTLRIRPTDDTYVDQWRPERNQGNRDELRVDERPNQDALLKYRVKGLAGKKIISAKLRMYVTEGSRYGGLFLAASNRWSEDQVTYNTKPRTYAYLDRLGPVTRGTWVDADVTNLVTGDGTYSVLITSRSDDSVRYGSRESDTRPRLILKVQ